MDTGNSVQVTAPSIVLLLLAAGLISSLITVVATKILEIWQKKIDYEHSLGRSLFEQKLAVAKAAISQRRIQISCLQTFLLLLDQVSKNILIILDSPPDHLRGMLEANKNELAKLHDPALETANALSLFFDIEESPDPSASAKRIMDLFMLIDTNTKLLSLLNNQYLATKDVHAREEIAGKATKLVAVFQENSKELAAIMEKGLAEILQVIKLIRAEMKQYEPRSGKIRPLLSRKNK
ncbi:MAG: hypothetical protein IMZ50_04780 [Candidatus Atribacteria bacterium]|nr:hypothetical protein [Candidatus Atribacteria bacterium]